MKYSTNRKFRDNKIIVTETEIKTIKTFFKKKLVEDKKLVETQNPIKEKIWNFLNKKIF